MRINFILISSILFFNTADSQPPRLSLYEINNIPLPTEMDKQVCISGIKYYNSKLYFASERCPEIFVVDPASGKIENSLKIQVPQNFEMEGLTSYKNKLYLVSENIAAVYEVDPNTNAVKIIRTSLPLPDKSKDGDGMEGIAANEKNNKFYLLRERNEEKTKSLIYTYSVIPGSDTSSFQLKYESAIELPLENPQWRYSDICLDIENSKLLCLKSFSKGKLRKQYLESIDIDENGNMSAATLTEIDVKNFSETSNKYKDLDFSMNLEGITIDAENNIYIISDNTSGKADCDAPAKEKTILLLLQKK